MEKQPKKTFLLVEDDPNDALLVELELKNEAPEIQVHWVSDGHEAMDYLEGKPPYTSRNTHPMPDVILLDLKMPRIGGFDFLEWLHSQAPTDFKLIPVIVMSNSSLENDVKRAYELGANSYFVKPFHFGEFRERIRLMGIMWGEFTKTPRVAG
jgi:DNA-binding response OmpR family regulator